MSSTQRRLFTVVVALSAAMVAQAFGRFTWGVVLPDARDDLLDGSNTAAGLFGTLNVSAYLVGTVVVAWLASRSTLVGLVKIGLTCSTSGLALASFTTEPVVLAGALVLMGLGGAIIWVAQRRRGRVADALSNRARNCRLCVRRCARRLAISG
ncbi:MAG: hypothetical protein ACPHJY_02805 [Acidimicrobiales bacterium]